MKEENKTFLTAEDVSKIIHRSENYSYKLIDTLNRELAQKGYITIRARVPRRYFFERVGVFFGEGEND